jgi:hypothetical protein
MVPHRRGCQGCEGRHVEWVPLHALEDWGCCAAHLSGVYWLVFDFDMGVDLGGIYVLLPYSRS